MPMPLQMVSSDQKSNIAPHFDYLDLRNAMMPLMMLAASHDADTNVNGIIKHHSQWHQMTKSHIAPHCSYHNPRNVVVALIMLLVSCDTVAGASSIN